MCCILLSNWERYIPFEIFYSIDNSSSWNQPDQVWKTYKCEYGLHSKFKNQEWLWKIVYRDRSQLKNATCLLLSFIISSKDKHEFTFVQKILNMYLCLEILIPIFTVIPWWMMSLFLNLNFCSPLLLLEALLHLRLFPYFPIIV